MVDAAVVGAVADAGVVVVTVVVEALARMVVVAAGVETILLQDPNSILVPVLAVLVVRVVVVGMAVQMDMGMNPVVDRTVDNRADRTFLPAEAAAAVVVVVAARYQQQQ